MKKIVSVLVMAMALMVGSATAVRADFAAGMKAFDAGNYSIALQEARPLAEQGMAKAQYLLGRMYSDGHGVAQNYKEAAKWMRKAAEQGHAGGQLTIGFYYQKGRGGVPQDDDEAVKWIRKAAEQGHAVAQLNLGFIYDKGRSVLRDKILAHMWSNISAANGFTIASNARTLFEMRMTASQIAEAQELARKCMKQNYKGCGR